MGPGTIIVISGLEEIRELMDKRSLVTADRPATYMGHLIANGMSMSMLSHGKTLARGRHAVSDSFHRRAMEDLASGVNCGA